LKLKAKKRTLFFLVIPFLLILISIFYFNKFNKNQVKTKFKEITIAEGLTIQNLIELSGYHLLDESENRLTVFLDRLYSNKSIIYIGLFKEKSLIYLLSRYEGFFPVSSNQEEFRIIDTPMGKIFEIAAHFKNDIDNHYRLYMGFDYEFLTAFENAAGRNFLLVAVIFSLVLLFIIALIVYFDRKFFQKDLELIEEKQEKERFKELSLLTSEIAHEIKNPLNSIYLSFGVLENYCSQDKDALFYREAIKSEIKRISRILQSYSDLSKEIRPEFDEVTLKDFINEFRLILDEELKAQNINFQINTQGNSVFKTDKNLLKQILLNLIKNAAEADASIITANITATIEHLIIEVKDNGKGIEEKIKDSIFKPYISTKTKGTGLGLHITQRLIVALKGKIELAAHTQGNTIFRVILPKM